MSVATTPTISLLSASSKFQNLTEDERRCIHHLCRAAWLGTRIILRQVSPEATAIFDFILQLHRTCSGEWRQLQDQLGIDQNDMRSFLEYAALFLHNIGNYYGQGDQKFIPNVTQDVIYRLSKSSALASKLYTEIAPHILDTRSMTLGHDSQFSQSCYYVGEAISPQEIAAISQILDKNRILPENTRVQKTRSEHGFNYEILCASKERPSLHLGELDESVGFVSLTFGDHAREIDQICSALDSACTENSDPSQKEYLIRVRESMSTGDMQEYKEAQKLWVQAEPHHAELIIGFVEPYRDPYGTRAEFEGVVGIVDKLQREKLNRLVSKASEYIADLPWARSHSPDNGPFETEGIGHRTFTSLDSIAYCSSLVFPGVNLPNYNDIRESAGYKNIIIANNMDAASMSGDSGAAFIRPDEAEKYLILRKQTYYSWVVFHELFGHGTGKLLAEVEPGVYNFDIDSPPINPMTGSPIKSWYALNQTFTGQFADIATSIDECRAECVGAILFGNSRLLEMLEPSGSTIVPASDREYSLFQLLGVAGLRSFESYSIHDQKWGQAHSRAHFAILRTLLEHGGGVINISFDQGSDDIILVIDRTKIASHGRPALENLALKLHIFRCTGDVTGCRSFYEPLTRVDGSYVQWAAIVQANKPAPRVFVQPNTFITGDRVVIKDYAPTIEGLIESWAERDV